MAYGYWNGGVNRRKLALTVQLIDPKDYEGGVFQCWFGGSRRFIDLPRQKGDVLVMPTFIIDNVSPITRGERRAWFLDSRNGLE